MTRINVILCCAIILEAIAIGVLSRVLFLWCELVDEELDMQCEILNEQEKRITKLEDCY